MDVKMRAITLRCPSEWMTGSWPSVPTGGCSITAKWRSRRGMEG